MFSPVNLVYNAAMGVANKTLPPNVVKFLDKLNQMRMDTEELRSRLTSIRGPLLPFCTANYKFDIDRLSFCSQVTADIIEIAAGGVGIANLVLTVTSQPEQVYGFLREAFLPIVLDLAAEGRPLYKGHLDKALNSILGVKCIDIMHMSYTQFYERVKGIKGKPAVVKGKPAVVKDKPAVVKGKPAVVKGKPAVVKGKPAVVKGKPIGVKGKPIGVKKQIKTN